MDNEPKNIDRLFRNQLHEYHADPPPDAWENIYSRLEKKPVRSLLFYMKWAAASVLILLAFGTGYYFALYQNQPSLAEKPILQEKPEIPPSTLPQTATNPNITRNAHKKHNPEPDRQPVKTITTQSAPALLANNSSHSGENSSPEIPEQLPMANMPVTVQDISESPDQNPAQTDDLAEFARSQVNPPVPVQVPPDNTPKMNEELMRKLLGTDDITPESENMVKNSQKWSVGGLLAPMYSYRSIEVIKVPEGTELNEEFYNQAENGITTLSSGLNINYAFNDNLTLQTGFVFSKIGQSNSDVPIFNEPGSQYLMQLNTSAGNIIINPSKFASQIEIQPADPKDTTTGNFGVNSTLFQNFSYVELPLVIKYNLIDRKIGFNVRGGLSPGFMVGNNSYFANDGNKLSSGITQDVNQVIYNSLIGFGIDIKLSKSLVFNLEPTFKYSLFSITSGEFVRMHPYSVSCFTGVSYKF